MAFNSYFYRCSQALIEAQLKIDEQRLEYMLRNCVTPVIQGEITKGKIKWRNLTLVRDFQGNFIGLQQRDKFIPLPEKFT